MKNKLIIIILFLHAFPVWSQSFGELASTPPMGWNSWNKIRCNISEKLIMEMADAMVESGMQDAGYQYIVIDDCWQVSRDSLGNIVPDPQKFPSGMKALADYIHNRGLKFGIYSCAGPLTCQERPGSKGYEFQDARTYAEWGVDYLKYDWCYCEGLDAKAAYKTMSDALKASGRPIIFSICEWGENKPWEWGKGIGHLWRTTEDIRNHYRGDHPNTLGVLDIIDLQADLWPYAGPGHWNDPDMLEIGNGGLTIDECKTHFSMWAMLAAPLMAGNDLRQMDENIVDILTNHEIIAIDKDPLGRQARKFKDLGEHEIWIKPLGNNEIAVCFMNRTDQPWRLNYEWEKEILNFEKNKCARTKIYGIRDLWEHKIIGKTTECLVKEIAPHGVLIVRLEQSDQEQPEI